MTFRLTMHPGADGDCLQLTWGTTKTLHHLIVDLGRGSTYAAVQAKFKALENVELFVMSHIDADHIAGAIPMVREEAPPFMPKRVWYNSRPQLEAAQARSPIVEPLGARQGEKLARGIVRFNWPWNADFASEIVSTDSPEAAKPIALVDGLTVRLLSPTDAQLVELLPKWDKELAAAHVRTFDPDHDPDPMSPAFEPFGIVNVRRLASGDFSPDTTETNGSSIAFVAEFSGKRVLLTGDAHSAVLEAALRPLADSEGGTYRLDLMKVSHHGSKANTSLELLRLVDCTRFAISTNGNQHDHPDRETIARVLVADKDRPKTLFFNYLQPNTAIWKSRSLRTRWHYKPVFSVRTEDDSSNGAQVIDI